MNLARRTARSHLVVATALAISGCGGAKTPPPPLCPRVGIINGLENHEQQGADGQLAYRTALENVDGACKTDGGDLVVEVAIDVVLQPGPALTGSLVEVPYFVAVSGPAEELLGRQDFVARIEVAPGARRAGVVETFRQRFVGRQAGASQYEVLFGLSLPEAEAMRQYQNR